MRGLLKIASTRAPYLRAGLSWPVREPVEVHVSTLDGARLRALIDDPLLTIQIADEAGAFHALPAIDRDISDATLQMMIDSFADALPSPVVSEADAELERLRAIEEAWNADQRHLHDQGFQTLDALTTAWAADRVALADKIAEFETAQADGALLLKTIADLRTELAAANKPAAKSKTLPKE